MSDAGRFDRAIAVASAGAGRYDAEAQAGWSAPPGPNGGYLAGIVIQAMAAEVADPGRPIRSITLHYLRAPQPGPLTIEVATERAGRNVTSLSARVHQGEQLCIVALGAFGGDVEAADAFAAAMPEVPAAAAVAPWPVSPRAPEIAQRFEFRGVIGEPPFSGAQDALTGGWMRLHEARALDAPLLALLADAWLPAVFTRLHGFALMPTIDLTIHFRDPAAIAAVAAGDAVLGVFSSTHAAGGYVEEDGQLWAPGGALLAQSRQLALVRPLP